MSQYLMDLNGFSLLELLVNSASGLVIWALIRADGKMKIPFDAMIQLIHFLTKG